MINSSKKMIILEKLLIKKYYRPEMLIKFGTKSPYMCLKKDLELHGFKISKQSVYAWINNYNTIKPNGERGKKIKKALEDIFHIPVEILFSHEKKNNKESSV